MKFLASLYDRYQDYLKWFKGREYGWRLIIPSAVYIGFGVVAPIITGIWDYYNIYQGYIGIFILLLIFGAILKFNWRRNLWRWSHLSTIPLFLYGTANIFVFLTHRIPANELERALFVFYTILFLIIVFIMIMLFTIPATETIIEGATPMGTGRKILVALILLTEFWVWNFLTRMPFHAFLFTILTIASLYSVIKGDTKLLVYLQLTALLLFSQVIAVAMVGVFTNQTFNKLRGMIENPALYSIAFAVMEFRKK